MPFSPAARRWNRKKGRRSCGRKRSRPFAPDCLVAAIQVAQVEALDVILRHALGQHLRIERPTAA